MGLGRRGGRPAWALMQVNVPSAFFIPVSHLRVPFSSSPLQGGSRSDAGRREGVQLSSRPMGCNMVRSD